MTHLFTSDLKVINVGLDSFADSILENEGSATKVAWRPPALEMMLAPFQVVNAHESIKT